MRWMTWRVAVGLSLLLTACGAQPAAQPETQTAALPTALPAVSAGAAQREAMNDPKQTVQLFADLVRQERYAEVEPLMTDFLRSTFVQGAGSVEAGFRAGQSDNGKLLSYSIGDVRTTQADAAEVDIDWNFERRQSKSTIVLSRVDGQWQVANIRDR
jgi:hypothetical protein